MVLIDFILSSYLSSSDEARDAFSIQVIIVIFNAPYIVTLSASCLTNLRVLYYDLARTVLRSCADCITVLRASGLMCAVLRGLAPVL